MNAIDKLGLERAAKVARVIAEHPDLPMLCLAPSTPSDYDSWYHDVCGAEVKRMLFPNEVAELYGDFYGLDCDRYYDDPDEVSERIEDYWLWGNDHGSALHGFGANSLSDLWIQVYRPIAEMMVEDMPWHEYIVIDCF